MTTTTTFENKCDILAEVFTDYSGDETFEDFVSYNDLGLPLAYAIATEIVKPTNKANILIDETFDMLLQLLVVEDIGFESLEAMFHAASQE